MVEQCLGFSLEPAESEGLGAFHCFLERAARSASTSVSGPQHPALLESVKAPPVRGSGALSHGVKFLEVVLGGVVVTEDRG